MKVGLGRMAHKSTLKNAAKAIFGSHYHQNSILNNHLCRRHQEQPEAARSLRLK